MVSLSFETSKREFLQLLTEQASDHSPLYVEVDSLPIFLNTSVAFTIFNYQISNYPRQLVWVTKNPESRRLLESCDASVVEQIPTTPRFVNSGPIASLPGGLEIGGDKPLVVASSPTRSIDIGIAGSRPANRHTPTQDHPEDRPVTPATDSTEPNQVENLEDKPARGRFTFPTFNKNARFQSDRINAESLLQTDRKNFHRSSLLEENTSSQDKETQNLDSWLERIAATKEALSSLKKEPGTQVVLADLPKEKPKTVTKAWSRRKFTLLGAMGLSVLAVGFLVLFPTKAYTLQVRPVLKQESTTLSIPQAEFSKRTVKLTAEANTPASGQQEVATERASGTVSLINTGNKDVLISNGLFRLITEDKQYEAVRNTSLPGTITIPARNNLNGPSIEIVVQARTSGSEFNLPENTRFTIVNLLGGRVCGSCYAVSTSEIKNTDLTGDKIVTESDYGLLRSTTEGLLAEQRVAQIQDIQEDKIFTNLEWYRNLEAKNSFSHELGQVAGDVQLKTEVSTELYYLPQQLLETKLLEKHADALAFTDLAIVETAGNLAQEQPAQIKVFYTYEQESRLDRQSMLSRLSGQDCVEAKTKLKEEFPNIAHVECRDVGVKLPGITPRVDIKMIEE